ncbi:uncharacterized protein LOC126161657 [Schistocerca cancellata]|uniref:uncharacterized protein LOC126161657 n=1 Tax=Schistocerca cancellata TaxID=274614 RepID=UPI002118BB0B|nr:uncharacterized protein LOC126161657 [Schistocerca cancellata]
MLYLAHIIQATPYDVSNFRPLSMLSGFSKIIERVMYQRLYKFLIKNRILVNAQNGFRKNKSTETAIFNFLQLVLNSINRKELNCGLFLDLSKAFDVIDHKLLLRKLYAYGIRGVAHKWFESYLSDRYQKVEMSQADRTYSSRFERVLYGVPQGSVLIFINDLPSQLSEAEAVLFADDTSLFVKANSEADLQEKVTLATDEADRWFNENRLIVNAKKTTWINFRHITNKIKTNLTVELGKCKIEQASYTKFLGVWFDEHLRWEKHLISLNKKLSQTCYILRMLKSSCNIKTVICFLKEHEEFSTLNREFHNYETRNRNDFHREIHKTAMYHKSVLYQPKISTVLSPKN